YIGTEHLLLGLVREGEGIAAGVLESLGVNLDKVRHEVIRVLSQSSSVGPAQETKRSSKTPTVDALGINLTEASRAGKLDPVIGREKEIERVIQILGRKTKNNPALIGKPGVGKTAIAEGLAHRIVAGDVPDILLNQRVLTLDIRSLVAGTKYRGEFEERPKKIIQELRNTNDAVLFIDEAASRVRLRHASAPPQLREAQRELDRLTKEKDGAINSQDYEAAAKLREDEATLREKVDALRAEWQTTIAGDAPTVDEEEIA